jgi:hypothetical protein
MSMLVLSPIFPFLSVIGGGALGVMVGVLFTIAIVAAHYRDFPSHLVRYGAISLLLVIGAALISFFAFRLIFGNPRFDVYYSLRDIILELYLRRAGFFVSGALLGFLGVAVTFLFGLSNGARQRNATSFPNAAVTGWR